MNEAISPFDQEIRSTFHQQSKERVYAIINSTSDPVTQLATNYSPDEIAFLKRVLDAMFETNNTSRHEVMAITSMEAVRLGKPSTNRRHTQNGSETQGSTGQGLTMVQAENMMKALVAQGWFEKSRQDYYTLSPRALMELRGWLFDTYNDEDEGDTTESERDVKIKLCHACRDIITVVSVAFVLRQLFRLTPSQGQRCPRRACGCRLHDICTESFFTMQRSRQCPVCKTEWTGEDFVGERAARFSHRASGASRPSLASNAAEVEAGEDGDLYD